MSNFDKEKGERVAVSVLAGLGATTVMFMSGLTMVSVMHVDAEAAWVMPYIIGVSSVTGLITAPATYSLLSVTEEENVEEQEEKMTLTKKK